MSITYIFLKKARYRREIPHFQVYFKTSIVNNASFGVCCLLFEFQKSRISLLCYYYY